MDEKRVADYFIISGVSESPEANQESKPLINLVLPITDIAVIFRGLGEKCPDGYTCIETTPGGHVADLNNGNFKSPNIQICYRRGNDKPPLVDVGVYYEDKDRVFPDVGIVYTTPYGRCASTGTNNPKSGTYITYRRAKTNSPFNQLVVVDLCVILNNKSEHPPHAFYSIKKNLNKSYYGMIGSEVLLCYKKTLLTPPSICYTPQIISRFPLQDYANFPLPETVPLFCLPAGASIEVRPINNPLPRPITSTFVLTSDSAQKIYGSAMTFYEPFDDSNLTSDQKSRLGLDETEEQDRKTHGTFTVKSICILSRWPFFDCFENFLLFLHKLVFNANYLDRGSSPNHRNRVPLEHHISHFLLDVNFPTPKRPTVLVQLMPGTDETVTISQPFSRLPLPLTGASFTELLISLGVENTMNVLLFGLCEQKILLHSLRPWILTGVAEAISAMLFPFHWQCPYVPLCPLSLDGILNAPLPFIVGIDSRCFDTFTPPEDVICIDLDTQSIYLSELKRCLNYRILPKRGARVLKNSLSQIFTKCQRFKALTSQSPQHNYLGLEERSFEKRLELEIQEAFVRFMATILRGFRSFLLPITRAPTVGATDPTSLFDFEGFLMSRDRNFSQFYQLITKTQMFTHYIEERSFVSDKNTSLAFFDDCEEKLSSSDDIHSDKAIKLFDKDDGLVQTDRSVYIPAPEQSPSIGLTGCAPAEDEPDGTIRKLKFGPLNPALFHRHPQVNNFPSIERALNESILFDDNPNTESNLKDLNTSFSISRRTKQEIKASITMAKRSHDNPSDWSRYLVSCCYCLWFSALPSYITYCKSVNSDDSEQTAKSNTRILRYAFTTIVRMQKFQLSVDEICFRILTLLCGYYGQPALAVRVFFEMKKAGIKPNAVTYGYYNRAVLESKWPDHQSKPTTVLWTKIRNVISGVALFKSHGRLRMERRNLRYVPMVGDPSFCAPNTDFLEGSADSNLFKPTTLPVSRNLEYDQYEGNSNPRRNLHRRSLINRSFSTHQESLVDIGVASDESNIRPRNQNQIHKSYSMHLRNGSPERNSSVRIKSSSIEDDEEPLVVQKVISNLDAPSTRKITSTNDLFSNLKERYQLLVDADPYKSLNENLHLIDNQAGILFASNQGACQKGCRSSSHSPNLIEDLTRGIDAHSATNNPSSDLLIESNLHETNNIADFLKTNSFGEDARILRKLEPLEQKPNLSESVDCLRDDASSEETRSNQLSDSMADPTEGPSRHGEESGLLKNITSTPNFKLSTILNDAGSLQWSKWTSSHNSKSVYKGIKSAATGIVSSLQEIKSSFSISNSNTPSKPHASTYHKSATGDWMRWANNIVSNIQNSKVFDDDEYSDCSSVGSNDLIRLSNEEGIDPSTSEVNDFRFCYGMFVALEKHYNNSSSKEDLLDHLSDTDLIVGSDEVAIEIKMTTCSRCTICSSLLYDEEIMERWSYNESNLNTKCIYCRAKIVPMMSITVDDHRFTLSVHNEKDKNETDDLVDLNFEQSEKDASITNTQEDPASHGGAIDASGDSNKQNFTVPYLSPIVLRKELESVFESSGDICPSNSKFVDEHPIIYWNLLWYFSRINVPTHLGLLCLKSNSILNGREIPEKWLKSDKVVVRTLWDNENLHTGIGKPLYRQLERGQPSTRVQAILCDEIFFTRPFLEKVISLIRTNELHSAMNLILNARLKSSTKFSFDKNRHNLYRDLIFLIIKLGPGKLYMDNFEREYKKAFESLNFQQVALNRFDRPPTIGSLFCRKSFKELSLCDK